MIYKTLKRWKERALTTYRGYIELKVNGGEILWICMQGILISGIFAYFFYRSFIAFFILLPIAVIYVIRALKIVKLRNMRILNVQFKDAILSVSNSLRAGYSIENAFIEALGEMYILHGVNSLIVKELTIIKRSIANNISLEEALQGFAIRIDIEDIVDFANIFAIAKRSGGNMREIIADTAIMIEEKVAVNEEINTLISAKRFEQKIMNIVPFFILLYVGMTSKGFFDDLYQGWLGRIIMTACMCLYMVAIKIADKIVTIDV